MSATSPFRNILAYLGANYSPVSILRYALKASPDSHGPVSYELVSEIEFVTA